tara:strand:+ start:1406 stop:1582 length:177 start_codon:yes stop_codon:yes gene_type:complete
LGFGLIYANGGGEHFASKHASFGTAALVLGGGATPERVFPTEGADAGEKWGERGKDDW